MQAVSGKYFQSSRSKQQNLPSFINDRQQQYIEQEVLLTSNCWGFAWEVLYQADNPDASAMTVSTADPTSAWRALTSPGFDLIQSTLRQIQNYSLKRQYAINDCKAVTFCYCGIQLQHLPIPQIKFTSITL